MAQKKDLHGREPVQVQVFVASSPREPYCCSARGGVSTSRFSD